MNSVIHQPHDKFFKLSMGEIQVAREFFTEHLPAHVLEKTDLETLKLENHSFVDPHYKNSEADVIYSVMMDHEKAYFFLLCEHQSTVDRWIAFRLWGYMIRLMELHLKQNPSQALPLIYPLIVYTGQEPWNAPVDLFSLFGDPLLAREWLLKPIQLLNIHQIADDEMRRRQWSGIVEFALKYRQVRDFKRFLKTLLPWIREIEQTGSGGFTFSKNLLKYVLDGTEAQEIPVFEQSIQEYLSPPLRVEIMTLAQQYRQQGVHQGIHQGEVAVLVRQLQRRFHRVPQPYLDKIEQADAETLLSWSEKLLDAKTFEEIFE